MTDIFNSLERRLFNRFRETHGDTKIGFERESLRINEKKISAEPHPKELGSALCNKFITTDFSEAQLEFVTPPITGGVDALQFLEDIHHFTTQMIGNEVIWPLSMPISIESQEDIPIAKYGKSNIGKLKELYRKGLSYRYGRMMQAISGFHYNYSVPEAFWNSDFLNEIEGNYLNVDFRSALYLNQIRNIYRFNWLIIYLFGASPIVSNSFFNESGIPVEFKKLGNKALYLPNSTSLRMSRYGYQNARRKMINVSLNSVDQYVKDLKTATNTINLEFEKLGQQHSEIVQLNNCMLQIDDEYYAIVRAKSAIESSLSTTEKIKKSGIDFIELRSLDLNPFSKIGIDKDTACFIEVLLGHCFIRQGSLIKIEDMKIINENDALVAENGGDPDLQLLRNGRKTKLSEWGNILLDELLPIAEVLDDYSYKYTRAIESAREKVNDPLKTLSAIYLDEFTSTGKDFDDYGIDTASSNKEFFLKRERAENKLWNLLEEQVGESRILEKEIEDNDTEDFEKFVEEYIN